MKRPAAAATAPPAISPASLRALSHTVVACRACPRLVAWRERVAREKKREFRDSTYWGRPVPGFGDPRARLLLVGLAPAAHGANRTGRMFTGDSSGDWLYAALNRYGFASQAESVASDDGLTLSDCYITAALRCAPPANKPTRDELARCQQFLAAELSLLDRVRVVVTLGRIGYVAWLRASGWWERLSVGERPPFRHGAVSALPDGLTLITSYHPSRQNTNTGRLTRGMWEGVFRRAREIVDRVKRGTQEVKSEK